MLLSDDRGRRPGTRQGRRSPLVPHDVRHLPCKHRGKGAGQGNWFHCRQLYSRPHQRKRSWHARHRPSPLGRDFQGAQTGQVRQLVRNRILRPSPSRPGGRDACLARPVPHHEGSLHARPSLHERKMVCRWQMSRRISTKNTKIRKKKEGRNQTAKVLISIFVLLVFFVAKIAASKWSAVGK